MIYNVFEEMDEEGSKSLIEQINPLIDLQAFSPKTSNVIKQELSFYPGYHFVQITDLKDKQKRRVGAVYKNQDIHVLNWNNESIYKLNKEIPLQLTKDNILSYILFFFSNVQGKEGRFYLVDTPEQIQWRDEPTKAAKRAIGRMIEPMDILSHTEELYTVKASIIFKRALFMSKINVDHQGTLEMYEQELLIEDLPVIEEF